MPKTISQTLKDEVREQLRHKKIFTLSQMVGLLSCAGRTAQRFLRDWQCHTSYNLNASYYALPNVVQFDSSGIWSCNGVHFSRYGNLTETLVGLVLSSPAGMTGGELGAIVKVQVHSLLPAMARAGKLAREKHHGRYVYFAVDPTPRSEQEQAREERAEAGKALSDADAVTMLVVFINEPTLQATELAERVRARAPTATVQAIKHFFETHGLEPAKKGALHSALSNCSNTTGNA